MFGNPLAGGVGPADPYPNANYDASTRHGSSEHGAPGGFFDYDDLRIPTPRTPRARSPLNSDDYEDRDNERRDSRRRDYSARVGGNFRLTLCEKTP